MCVTSFNICLSRKSGTSSIHALIFYTCWTYNVLHYICHYYRFYPHRKYTIFESSGFWALSASFASFLVEAPFASLIRYVPSKLNASQCRGNLIILIPDQWPLLLLWPIFFSSNRAPLSVSTLLKPLGGHV